MRKLEKRQLIPEILFALRVNKEIEHLLPIQSAIESHNWEFNGVFPFQETIGDLNTQSYNELFPNNYILFRTDK